MNPTETPQVAPESFSSAVVIPATYTAYRDETCESASKVKLPTFPDNAELEIAVTAAREVKDIIDKVTDIEELARKPLNAALKKMRADRDTFLIKPKDEYDRIMGGIKAFQNAKYLHDQAEARRLQKEKDDAAIKEQEATREIKRLQNLAIVKEGEVTTRDGLLIRNGEVIPLPEADAVAEAHGFTCAERMVKSLQAASVERGKALITAQLAQQEAELDKQSVATQLAAPTNTPRNLTTKVRWDFEIVDHQKCVEQMSAFIFWKKDEEIWKFDRAGFLKSLNREAEPISPFLPKDGEQEAINSRVGIRVFIDVRPNVRP